MLVLLQPVVGYLWRLNIDSSPLPTSFQLLQGGLSRYPCEQSCPLPRANSTNALIIVLQGDPNSPRQALRMDCCLFNRRGTRTPNALGLLSPKGLGIRYRDPHGSPAVNSLGALALKLDPKE